MLHNDIALSKKIQSEIRLMLSFKHENIVEVRSRGPGRALALAGAGCRAEARAAINPGPATGLPGRPMAHGARRAWPSCPLNRTAPPAAAGVGRPSRGQASARPPCPPEPLPRCACLAASCCPAQALHFVAWRKSSPERESASENVQVGAAATPRRLARPPLGPSWGTQRGAVRRHVLVTLPAPPPPARRGSQATSRRASSRPARATPTRPLTSRPAALCSPWSPTPRQQAPSCRTPASAPGTPCPRLGALCSPLPRTCAQASKSCLPRPRPRNPPLSPRGPLPATRLWRPR
jgi:hypothetical protein